MLILNPAAGNGAGTLALGSIVTVLCSGGYSPTVFVTADAGDATKLVLEHAGEYECVTCIGGDGTLSETVAGLAQMDKPPLLGYIPQGTANDVAATLKLSKNPIAAAKTIINGTPINLDVGKLNESSYFTYIAAFGAFTEVSYETPRESKQVLGHLAYVLNAMTKITKITSYPATVEYDQGEISGDYVFGSVSNSTSVAGLVKLDKSGIELNDGLFEVILIRNPKNIIELNQIITNVLSNNFTGSNVIMLKSKNVKFSFDRPVKWTRDGESGGLHSQVFTQNLHSAIRIMT